MKILLNVPYAEKDAAKARGAKWDPNIRSWYISNVQDIHNFLQWLPEHDIVCENLYLLKMQQRCWKCGEYTEVVLLATDKSYSNITNYQMDSNVQVSTQPDIANSRNLWYTFANDFDQLNANQGVPSNGD